MPVLLVCFNWIFFVYRENERHHAHIFKKGDVRTVSAKVFLTKNGKRDISWASYGKYKKNHTEIQKIIEDNYDWLIKSAKDSASGKQVKPKIVNQKVKRLKK